MKPTAATITFVPTPNGYEVPVICFEYDWRKQAGTFRRTSRIVVGKVRETRLALANNKAAA